MTRDVPCGALCQARNKGCTFAGKRLNRPQFTERPSLIHSASTGFKQLAPERCSKTAEMRLNLEKFMARPVAARGVGHDAQIQNGFRHSNFHRLFRCLYVGRRVRRRMEGFPRTHCWSAPFDIGGERNLEARRGISRAITWPALPQGRQRRQTCRRESRTGAKEWHSQDARELRTRRGTFVFVR